MCVEPTCERTRPQCRICIITSMGWGVRNVLMSRAVEAVGGHCELRLLTAFAGYDGFHRCFGSLGPIDEIVDPDLSRLARLIYHRNTTAFFRLSPSATHQYKLDSQAEQEGKAQGRPRSKPGWRRARRTGPLEAGHLAGQDSQFRPPQN